MNIITLLYKRVIPIIICALMCVLLVLAAGCSDTGDFTLYFGVNTAPKNLDPQLASVDSELIFARNCFRGLYKLDESDSAVPDLAADCTLSSDGLTYTFKLKSCKWSDDSIVTAADFRFALLRAADPAHNAPQVEYIRNITGVDKKLNGIETDIGVSAPDDKTLIITLNQPDPNFTLKLTKAIFMPCNEAFFIKCGGKYGLSKDHILTNGKFTISKWQNEKSVVLKRVTEHKTDGTAIKTVVLSESQTGKLNSQRIMDNEIGMTIVEGDDFTKIDQNKYAVNIEYCKNYAIVFNKSTEIGRNEKLLEALATGVDRVFIKQNISDRFKTAYSCIPENATVLETAPLGEPGIKDYTFESSVTYSRSLFLDAVKSFKNSKLPTLQILCPDDPEIKAILTNAVYGWQSNLGVIVNIKTVQTEQELLQTVKNGQYTVAFVPLEGSAEEILTFLSDNASAEYRRIIGELNSTDNANAARSLMVKASDILASEPSVIPIVSIPTAKINAADYRNVHFSKIDNTVDFSIIYK